MALKRFKEYFRVVRLSRLIYNFIINFHYSNSCNQPSRGRLVDFTSSNFTSFPFILFLIHSYQLSHAIFLLHFLLQLFETVLHALMERSQVVCYSLPMQRDSSTEQRYLRMKMYDVNRTNVQNARPQTWWISTYLIGRALYLPCDEVFEPKKFLSIFWVLQSVLFCKECLTEKKYPGFG